MFKKKNYKKIVISILALTMMLGTVALAAEGIFDKKITATYGRIKFSYEGNDVTKLIESQYGTPAFTVDGRAYAPVRAIADLLGVEVDYDNNTHTAKITDSKTDKIKSELDSKKKELAEKNEEIDELKKEIKKLKDGTVDKTDLKSLQTSLNKDYGEYEKLEFDIVLKENKDKVTIDINTDLKNSKDRSNWINMRYVDKKYLIEDIVDEVRSSFGNVEITGSIYDTYDKRDLYTFRQTKNGSLSISESGSGGGGSRYDDYLDEIVDDEFYAKGIDDARLGKVNYSSRTVRFEITFTDKYEKNWDKLSNKQIESMLDYIAREMEYDYKDSEYVEGDIYMGNYLLGTYDKEYGRAGEFKAR